MERGNECYTESEHIWQRIHRAIQSDNYESAFFHCHCFLKQAKNDNLGVGPSSFDAKVKQRKSQLTYLISQLNINQYATSQIESFETQSKTTPSHENYSREKAYPMTLEQPTYLSNATSNKSFSLRNKPANSANSRITRQDELKVKSSFSLSQQQPETRVYEDEVNNRVEIQVNSRSWKVILQKKGVGSLYRSIAQIENNGTLTKHEEINSGNNINADFANFIEANRYTKCTALRITIEEALSRAISHERYRGDWKQQVEFLKNGYCDEEIELQLVSLYLNAEIILVRPIRTDQHNYSTSNIGNKDSDNQPFYLYCTPTRAENIYSPMILQQPSLAKDIPSNLKQIPLNQKEQKYVKAENSLLRSILQSAANGNLSAGDESLKVSNLSTELARYLDKNARNWIESRGLYLGDYVLTQVPPNLISLRTIDSCIYCLEKGESLGGVEGYLFSVMTGRSILVYELNDQSNFYMFAESYLGDDFNDPLFVLYDKREQIYSALISPSRFYY